MVLAQKQTYGPMEQNREPRKSNQVNAKLKKKRKEKKKATFKR